MFTKRKMKNALITICALSTFVILTLYINALFIPNRTDDVWSVDTTYGSFYDEPVNSLDVLFIGSSFGACAFSPKVLEEEFGIRSHNLCCEQQSIFTSYYWLLEALRLQSPKVVVMDPMLLFLWEEESPLNSSEPFTRAAFDAMHWSAVKKAAIDDLCAKDETHELASYYFPLRRYHDRWKDLDALDFDLFPAYDPDGLRGYVQLTSESENSDYVPFYPKDVDHYTETVPLMVEYLDRIVALCKERGIQLCLLISPTTAMNNTSSQTIANYAKERGILYFDMNEYRFYSKIGYDFAKDNAENSHANESGARKITTFVGELLQVVYGL